MDVSILEDLGLSKGEIKVYTTLLEIGITKVGTIIEKSKIDWNILVHEAQHQLFLGKEQADE